MVGEKMKIRQIPNPNPGLEASQVMVFTKHDSDRVMPVPMLHQNSEYQTDVKVIYPKNTLVGLDIYYSPVSTLGQLHASDSEISGSCMVSYALYNDQVHQLSEMEPEGEVRAPDNQEEEENMNTPEFHIVRPPC
jgi:hypothetical protein